MLKLEKLFNLCDKSYSVVDPEFKKQSDDIDNLMSEFKEDDLYNELLLLKKENYTVNDIFKFLLNFRIFVHILIHEEKDNPTEIKVFPSWKVFNAFMIEVKAFHSKDIPIEEWQDLGEEAIDILIEILNKNISDIYNYARFEYFDQRWKERFNYLLNVKGYKRLLEFGPEY